MLLSSAAQLLTPPDFAEFLQRYGLDNCVKIAGFGQLKTGEADVGFGDALFVARDHEDRGLPMLADFTDSQVVTEKLTWVRPAV